MKFLAIENFRSIRKRIELDFSPLTILTGTNSSGKSTIIHALQLLKDEILNENKPSLTRIRINELSNHLGSFADILSKPFVNDTISFEYPFHFSEDDPSLEYRLFFFVVNWRAKVDFTINKQNREEGRLSNFTMYHPVYGEFIKISITDDEEIPYWIKIDINHLIEAEKEYYQNDPTVNDPLFQPTESHDNLDNIKLQWDCLKKFYLDGYPVREDTINLSEVDIFESDELTGWSELTEDNFIHFREFSENGTFGLTSKFLDIRNFLKLFFKKIKQQNKYIFRFKHLGSLRGISKRVYFNNDPFAIPEASSDFFYSNLKENSNEVKFVNKWLKEFEIGERLEIVRHEGAATSIYLVKDKDRILLADLGYGISQFFPILLEVINCSLNKKVLIIEEPEANLHPKFQSLLADLFVDAYQKLGVRFILETHSEYLVRKMQYLVAKKAAKPEDLALYYFEGEGEVRRINFMNDGRLDQEFGPGFYDESVNLAIELLTISTSQNN